MLTNLPTQQEMNMILLAGIDAELSNKVQWPLVSKLTKTIYYAKWIPNVINVRLNDDVVSWKKF